MAQTAQAIPLPKGNRRPVLLPPTFTANYNFNGIIALDDCSGSLIRFESSQDTDHAMMLTNGHCYEGGFPAPGKYIINQPSTRSIGLMADDGSSLGSVSADTVVYSTMTTTDISLYRLSVTYADLKNKYKIQPLTLSSQHPAVGQNIEIISGYWDRGYTCGIEAFVYQLSEDGWTWNDSIRYSRPGCDVIGGTSGSPVVLAGTRTVVGVNNTINEDGQKCSLNNPCEIDQNGKVTYQQGYGYAEETYQIYSCLDVNTNQFNFAQKSCVLPH
jgi:hypothetical protein